MCSATGCMLFMLGVLVFIAEPEAEAVLEEE